LFRVHSRSARARCRGLAASRGLRNTDLPQAAYFVQAHPGDTHDLDEVVADALVRHGLNATTAEPATYDYRVTYIDRWYWDMRMYLIDFRIDVRDAETNVLVATARSFQTSLAALGRRREDIIEDAVRVLLEGRQVATPRPRRRRRGLPY